MSLKEELEKLCQIQESFINEIFDYFFEQKIIKCTDLKCFDKSKHYHNFEIIKIEIKNGKTYEEFIETALTKITNYFLDGESGIKGSSNQESREFVFKQLNKYIPIKGVSLNCLKTLKNLNIGEENFRNGDDFINYLKNLKSNNDRIKACKTFNINIFENINVTNLDSEDSYILSNGSIKTTREILGYLHGDIGEFIIFLLTEGALKSPLLFSKVKHCKSSPGDKVKGSDGIHISADENDNIFYNFLEAKINKDFKSSLRQVIESNKEFLDNNGKGDIDNEITILYSNIDTIDKKYHFLFKGGFEKSIFPYLKKAKQNKLPFHIVCLISYNGDQYKNYKNGIISKKDYIDKISLSRIKNILSEYKLIEDKLNGRRIKIFMLPLINEVELIKIFLNKIKVK